MHYDYNITSSINAQRSFMMKYNINKDLNIFLQFSSNITPLAIKNDLQILMHQNETNLSALRLNGKLVTPIKRAYAIISSVVQSVQLFL